MPLQSVTLLLGSPFSGSSLLGQSLNDVAGIAYAGEIDNMHAFGFDMHRASNHYRSRCVICETHERYDCPIYPPGPYLLRDPGSVPIEDYLEVLSRFGAPFVVDGSKNVDWLWYLHQRGLLDALPTRAILVARSVWAFVASQLRTGTANPYQAAEGWRNIYRHALRTISLLAVPNLVVRHEAFVADSDKWLSRAAWFVSDRPHNLFEPKPLHCVGGNPSAYAIRSEFDRQGHLHVQRDDDDRSLSLEKFAFFGGDAPRNQAIARWAARIDRDQARAILAIPGVMDTMLDLGYDPLRILEEHAALLAAAA
ncbi:MAG TPA: hypothetical protein VLM17_10905 [Xanthomonadaceae bacterium]|nr:hypothetical protein [Xanthomonadaceae bacterium]